MINFGIKETIAGILSALAMTAIMEFRVDNLKTDIKEQDIKIEMLEGSNQNLLTSVQLGLKSNEQTEVRLERLTKDEETIRSLEDTDCVRTSPALSSALDILRTREAGSTE